MPETSPIPVLRWRCDIARPAPRALQIYRGETARLECLLTLQGDPATIPSGATATLAWQSRDMGASWYTAEASVDVSRGAVLADFTPAMDSGAEEFRAFLRVDGGEGSGICYRAAALLQMLDSPGATINEIPIPPRVLDFSTIEVLNAPYYTKEESDARFASVADATLNGRGFSEWTVTPATYSGYPIILVLYDGEWVPMIHSDLGDSPIGIGKGGESNTDITWSDAQSETTVEGGITATRTALPGYVLGPDTAANPNHDKPLPKLSDVPAVVAPSTAAEAAGKAADAKAVADALAGKVSTDADYIEVSEELRVGNVAAYPPTECVVIIKDGVVIAFNGTSSTPVALPGGKQATDPTNTLPIVATTNQIPAVSAETWTFEVDDGQGGTTTVTKSVAVFAAQNAQAAQGGA